MIWERVRPHGLVPPSQTWYSRVLRHVESGGANAATETRWHFRFVVQPRLQHVFGPLQANRESRGLWLPLLSRTPRELHVQATGSNSMILFDTPFISYDTDTFAVFEAWETSQYLGLKSSLPDMPSYVDPFIGLDRTRIRHVAICEVAHKFELSHQALSLQTLPTLDILSILTLGPDVFNQDLSPLQNRAERTSSAAWLEMPAVDVQNLDCELLDLPLDAVAANPFLNAARPRHAVGLTPDIRPLPRYVVFTKAWLWHIQQKSEGGLLDTATAWWDFIVYVFEDEDDADRPVLLPGCGALGHTKAEMSQWQPSFDIGHKILCARDWLSPLEDLGLFRRL